MLERRDYIKSGEYFMGVAILASMQSKDPNTQVGSCIVDNKERIISTGYNCPPKGFDDAKFPWAREGDELETKYPYVCHSELNAIAAGACGHDLSGSTIYVTLFPCNECAKMIVQFGIKKVIYLSDKYNGTKSNTASKKILEEANVECVEYTPKGRKIEIDV